jgi:hypothetical protein
MLNKLRMDLLSTKKTACSNSSLTNTSQACAACGCLLNLDDHANIVFDGLVWCLGCRKYPSYFTNNRDILELKNWSSTICNAFNQEPVHVLENPEAKYNWRLYWLNDKCLLAVAYHDQRAILLYPPGQRLITLCHEMAHIFTKQDHTPLWAETFASLVAWVKKARSDI